MCLDNYRIEETKKIYLISVLRKCNLFCDVPAHFLGLVVAAFLLCEVGDLLDGVHAVFDGLGGTGQVRGRTEDVETFHLRNVVTFGHRNLLRDGDGSLLASLGGVRFTARRGGNFSLGDHRLRMMDRLCRMVDVMRLGVVLDMKFFLGIVVKWLGFVQVYNVLYGCVV